ncbi:MAG: hypothetical protein WDO56_06795 [Gammaproteobacteria bacterium]
MRRRFPATGSATSMCPESSCGIPNPDTIYRFIPVDGASHYVITGHVAKHQPIENNFTLASFNLTTIANLNGHDLKVEPDGSFTITIDPEPANGRPNHLQSRHDAFQVWIRDTLGDWAHEKPNRLTVKRVDAQAFAADRRRRPGGHAGALHGVCDFFDAGRRHQRACQHLEESADPGRSGRCGRFSGDAGLFERSDSI